MFSQLYFDLWFILRRCALDVPRSGEGRRNLTSSVTTWGFLELRARTYLESTSLCNKTHSLFYNNCLRNTLLSVQALKHCSRECLKEFWAVTKAKGRTSDGGNPFMPRRVRGFD